LTARAAIAAASASARLPSKEQHETVVSSFLYLSLVAFPAALMATTPVSSPQSDEKAALRQAIDQYMVTLFKPGEMDPNWNKEGADLAKALDAKPNHVLVEVDKDGRRSIMIYTGRSMTTFVPAEWSW
jgi:hypothetical protein